MVLPKTLSHLRCIVAEFVKQIFLPFISSLSFTSFVLSLFTSYLSTSFKMFTARNFEMHNRQKNRERRNPFKNFAALHATQNGRFILMSS